MKKYIILIGFPKAGTSSLHRALKSANIPSFHQLYHKKSKIIGKILIENYKQNLPILHSFSENVYALTEINYIDFNQAYWPQLDYQLLEKICKETDNYRFILNYRNPTKLVNSMKNWHNNFHKRLIDNEIPGLPIGRGQNNIELENWVENHYTEIRKRFSEDKNFLEIDIESKNVKEKLSDFLDLKINWWGIENKTK